MNLFLSHTLALFVALLVLSGPAAAAMQVIQLQHRTASDMAALLAPLLASDERVAGQGQQLIVQASNRRLKELESLLQQLDTPMRRLLITLDDTSQHISSGQQLDARGRIRTRQGDIVLGEQGQHGNQVSIRRYSSSGSDQGQRSIQTLEGQAARISTGQQISRQQLGHDRHGRPQLYSEQRELDQGFYVVARVQGNQVVLELDVSNDQLSPRDARIINTSSVSTRVSGPLGSWIEVGQLLQDSQHRTSGLTENSTTYSNRNNGLRIKVEVMD